MRIKATIPTKAGVSYIGKLCRHFVHKIEATYSGNTGKAVFPFGTCVMQADEAHLTFEVNAQSAADAEKIKGVIDRHLVKFAYKEELDINWQGLG